ncbi:hypothetical protein GA0115243_102144 [Streptomyces sp. ScaeMP-e83]|nr:hypothetical protein GA0115243_102144 [Streptomyces sp. ScaeMP-e83]
MIVLAYVALVAITTGLITGTWTNLPNLTHKRRTAP